MSGRTYALILFFWAVLTIVTPMLIHLSASAKLHARSDGESREETKVMLPLPRRALVKTIVSPTPAPAPTPGPASSTELAFGDGKDITSIDVSHHLDHDSVKPRFMEAMPY